jgi:hypothetical protein
MPVVSSTVAAVFLVVPVAPAFAEAGAPASCVGHESSAISPPGSSDEFPTGRPGLNAFIKSTFPGTPPGAIVSTVAKLHEGSHTACDEALEE